MAAGLAPAALGSDTDGSIRGPAALCGIVGLKPTYGLVSRHGVYANSFSFDHAGPVTWTVEDCAIMLQTIAGHDPSDPASAARPVPEYRAALTGEIKGLRIIEVDYEDLIANGEAVTRRLIAFSGLDWHDACREPERNKRTVRTASVWQARQPVYSTSVARWRRYEPWLGELRDLLI